jgi:transposase
MADLARHFQQQGYEKLDVFLDHNPTHKQKMKNLFQQKNTDLTIEVNFHYLAPYSPKLNLVEYAIHLIRLKILYHADHKTPLKAFENLMEELCQNHKILSKEQIVNILDRIERLVKN